MKDASLALTSTPSPSLGEGSQRADPNGERATSYQSRVRGGHLHRSGREATNFASAAHRLIIVALLVYWAISLNRLDALPMVREDEPWQTAPGYSFWTRGVYGSELFADFAHMNQRYYLFQPTFSLLLGLAARLWGLGLFQIRIVPVALGALTICLAHLVATRIGGRAVGVATVYLLLLWRWSASTSTFASGVTLLDQSRIARYDTLVPLWGLAAWYAFIVAQQSQRRRHFVLVGVFVGLAGLAHLYGLFWLGVFVIVLWSKSCHESYKAVAGDSKSRLPGFQPIARLRGHNIVVRVGGRSANGSLGAISIASTQFLKEPEKLFVLIRVLCTIRGKKISQLCWIVFGALVAWTPWLLYIAAGWDDFVAQTINYANRFDLLNARFYLDNLLHEPLRYGLARATLVQAVSQPGVWLLVLGVPASLVWLWRCAQTKPTLRVLLVPALVLPIAFASLLLKKTEGYSLSVLPIFVIAVAYVAIQLWQSRHHAMRVALLIVAFALALDSAWGIANQQRWATESTSYREFMAQVRAVVPRPARVVGLHQYWLGLAENDFRSYTDVAFLTSPDYTRNPRTIDQVLEMIAPDILIVDAILGDVIACGDDPTCRDANSAELAMRFHLYMNRHHTREVGRVTDKTYGALIVYAVSP